MSLRKRVEAVEESVATKVKAELTALFMDLDVDELGALRDVWAGDHPGSKLDEQTVRLGDEAWRKVKEAASPGVRRLIWGDDTE